MSRISSRQLGLGVLAAVLALAAVLTQMDLRLASSQGVTLTARATDATVPLDDPLASVWQTAEPLEIPLSEQNVALPLGGGSIRTVTARALHDGDRIFFRLEWEDTTEDTSAFTPEEFRDAVAIQFPAKGVSTTPSFCMGQPGGEVNLWHWKADWQSDIDSGFVNVQQAFPNSVVDFYPFADDEEFNPGLAVGNPLSQVNRTTPVENLVARGFGTLTSGDSQLVDGKGVWQDNKWYVLFARDLEATGDTYTPFSAGQSTDVAFAVWDGSAGERNGLKSVSLFASLVIEEGPDGDGTVIGDVEDDDDDTTIILMIVFVLVVIAAAGIALAVRRQIRRA
ncbi:MAG: ethylbenzene dehydrogenase-related protein [Dehalococcoidia bacterium]